MATRRRRRTGLGIGTQAVGVLVLGVGVTILALGVPRLFGAVGATAGNVVVERLRTQQEVGTAALGRARAALSGAGQMLSSDYAAPRDLALVELVAASRAEAGSAEREAAARASIAAGIRSLGNNPAQPYAWFRLAQAHLTADGVSPSAVAAFRMSLETGGSVIDLMQPRVVMGLVLWPALDDGLRDRLRAQIRGLARYNPRILAETVLNRPGLTQVREALAGEPDLMNAFLAVYLKRRTPGYRPPL